MTNPSGKKTVGLVEKVKVSGKKTVEICALFDTGARMSSIDLKLASKIGLGPITRVMKVRSASSTARVSRPVVQAVIEIMGQRLTADINIQERTHMDVPMLIGRNVMSGRFVVDPEINEDKLKRMKKNENRTAFGGFNW